MPSSCETYCAKGRGLPTQQCPAEKLHLLRRQLPAEMSATQTWQGELTVIVFAKLTPLLHCFETNRFQNALSTLETAMREEFPEFRGYAECEHQCNPDGLRDTAWMHSQPAQTFNNGAVCDPSADSLIYSYRINDKTVITAPPGTIKRDAIQDVAHKLFPQD